MARSRIIKDDLKYLLFSEIYLRYDEPKSRRKAFTILETAIGLFDKKGFENVTLAMIARECGVTRPLLSHYFASLSEIRDLSIKYTHLIAQNIVIDAIKETDTPDVSLTRYVEAHLKWAMNFKTHVRMWLGFLNASSRKAADRKLNSLAVSGGTKRIEDLIRRGVAAGVFEATDPYAAARLIQTLMLGWLVSLVTEEDENIEALTKNVVRECLRFAGSR